ncbi:MAG: nucleoside recognition domain-containing protein [Oscillospiraceae bacterium]
MMTWVFGGLILASLVFAAMSGNMSQLSSAALNESANAVELVITLMGTICLWSGLMNVADKSGLTGKISNLLSPIISLLFNDMDKNSPAAKAISMNMTANLLGLGNSATPLGICAMKEMEKELKDKTTASDNMITFVVLNTASLQLIPTTTAMLRLKAGCQTPLDILPAVLICSALSVGSGVIAAKILSKVRRRHKP